MIKDLLRLSVRDSERKNTKSQDTDRCCSEVKGIENSIEQWGGCFSTMGKF